MGAGPVGRRDTVADWESSYTVAVIAGSFYDLYWCSFKSFNSLTCTQRV